MPKGDTMQRCFETLKAFNEGPVTAGKLAKRLNVSRFIARRWIDQASRYFPIAEVGLDRSNFGRPAVIYKLIKNY